MSKLALSGLFSKLVLNQLLTEAEAQAVLQKSEQSKRPPISEYLAEHPEQAMPIAKIAMEAFHLPLLDASVFNVSQIDEKIRLKPLIEEHRVLPLMVRKGTLMLAVADPSNTSPMDAFKFQTRLPCEMILADGVSLEQAIDTVLSLEDTLDLSGIDVTGIDSPRPSEGHGNVSEAPIVQYIDKILIDAIEKGASDIHFEPYETYYRIRVRRDGVLTELVKTSPEVGPRISARLKVMSQLNISERRIPQDGRFKHELSNGKSIDFRVSTCPTLFGEKVVLRILDSSAAQMGIDALGYESQQKQQFLDAIHKPQGMVLVTGPTGSGKTVSLYTALNILNTDTVNISTAEDPVEINLPGINQVNVNPKVGLTFAAALKSFLRQDPDIVMVGEIRDLETAETAVKAAQTGHLVLSTLHTNSAPETVVRLINMGIPVYNLATALSLVIAQRLARRLCDACKKPVDLPDEALLSVGFHESELKKVKVHEPAGCTKCQDGYKGRVGLYEVMPITTDLSTIIMAGGNAIELAKQAEAEGVYTIHRAGLNKVAEGLTSIDEVLRVTKD